MPKGHPLVLIGDRTLFQVNVSESFTVPTTILLTSPSGATADTRRPTVGGQLLLAVKDGAGPNNAAAFEIEVNPADVIALSAVASNVVTVSQNGTVIGRITGVTAAASVVGWYA